MEKIIQTLAELVESHAQLLELAKAKQSILIEGKVEGLQSIVNRENACVQEIDKLDKIRALIVQEYMTRKRINGVSFTLEDVLNHTDDPSTKVRLTAQAKQLRSLIEEISKLNDSNQQLIQTSLSYIQFSINMHVRKEPAIGYGPNKGNRFSSLLDAKI